MIPIKDYNSPRRFPVLTFALLVSNVAVFIRDRMTGHYERVIVQTGQGDMAVNHFVGGLSERLALVPTQLIAHPFIEWPTIFTSMFLHGNWLHIGSNMLYLWIFGNNIEDTLGRARFLPFYFTCGAAAGIAQVLSDPSSSVPMVGASGAVAGILGAYLILFPRARILTLVPVFIIFFTVQVPAYFIIVYWALIQFVNAYWLGGGEMGKGGVAYYAHLGGFAAGIVLIL
ncbi:MAG TPA: rhomboid family intramembrane serine protease, partial [Geobacteraceae bacterium]|nr:rhomboid family intramembrane serine protease [Geobacteraceae bacterium]